MKRPRTWIPTDKKGKVFIALEHGLRRCLVCEEWFSREDSRLHSDAVCLPMPVAVPTRGIKERLN
jgi:hypothetical protein